MPNWCENSLTITGPDVKKVLEYIRSDNCILDFNKIIPYPKMYLDMDLRSQEYEKKRNAILKENSEDKLEALYAEYGVTPDTPWLKNGFNSGGYEWCLDNWGTKWNSGDVQLSTRADPSKPMRKTLKCAYCQTVHKTESMIVLTCKACGAALPDEEPIQAYLEFNTAWSPPIPVIEKLASIFSDHVFEIQYHEGGIGFNGHAYWSEGSKLFHRHGNDNELYE
jgi:hypothetical protein